MSQNDLKYLEVEISKLMKAALVTDADEMQWALDIIRLSNLRRGDNQEIFIAKRDACIDKIKQLPMTLQIVKAHKKVILEAIKPTYWDSVSEQDLDKLIHDLGPLMKHRDPSKSAFRVLDLKDSVVIRTWLEIDGKSIPKTKYQDVVSEFITGLASQSEAVRKVRDGEEVSATEIEEIGLLFEGCEHPISIETLREAWGAKRVKLEEFLTHILRGEDLPDWETTVKNEFQAFIQKHSTFNARQITMLETLCQYVIDNETVAKAALVEAPFTQFDRKGFRGVFEMDQINEILSFTEALTA